MHMSHFNASLIAVHKRISFLRQMGSAAAAADKTQRTCSLRSATIMNSKRYGEEKKFILYLSRVAISHNYLQKEIFLPEVEVFVDKVIYCIEGRGNAQAQSIDLTQFQ